MAGGKKNMNVREKRIEIIRNNLAACVAAGSAASYYAYGSIPQRCIQGAQRSYIGNVPANNILGLIDTTVFGGGERGMVFTTEGIYFRDIFTSGVYYSYEECQKFSIPNDVYFNGNGISNMLSMLCGTNNEIGEGGIKNVLIDLGKEILNEGLSYLANYADIEEQEQKRARIKQLEEIKEVIKDIDGYVGKYENTIFDFRDKLEDSAEKLAELIIVASIISNEDLEEFEMDNETEEKEYREALQENFEMVDYIFNDDAVKYGYEKIEMQRAAKRFFHRIKSVYEEIRESDKGELEERIREAIIDFREVLFMGIKQLNRAIDEYYE